MTTPYWGQLPGPKLPAQTKARRASGDYGTMADRRQSLDGASQQGQPHPRANRISVQTTNTDAPTESTLSPFASPTASSFQGQGLAPRPPSLPYGANQYPPDLYEKRRRRTSRNSEPDNEYAADPPPAAPEVPRGPPVSYKHPYGNGGLPYTYPAPAGPPRVARRPEEAIAQMDAEEYYKASPQAGQDQYPVLDRSRKTLDGKTPTRPRRSSGSDQLPAGSSAVREAANGHRDVSDPLPQQRKFSLATQSDRRRKFADDRSPLQRLELTLDSITKEEKRARVEAAEQAARERAERESARAAEKGAGQEKSPAQPAQQVRFRDGRPSDSQEEQKPVLAKDTAPTRQEHSLHKGPLSQNPPEPGRRYGSASAQVGHAQPRDAKSAAPTGAQGSRIPQRNLSFRERAAKNDLKLPNGLEDDMAKRSPVTSPTGGASLARSGSNKLKKNPPGDPWFSKRMEAEEKYGSVQPRNGAPAEAQAKEAPLPAPAPGLGSRPAGESARGKALAPAAAIIPDAIPPSGNRRPSGRPEVLVPAGAKLSKAPSQRRGSLPPDQPTGQPAPPGEGRPRHAAKTGLMAQDTEAVAAVTVATAAVAELQGAAGEEDHDSDDQVAARSHRHHISDLVYHARDKFRPGQGMYKPPNYLDEWKKATVGTLSGALLDLGDEPESSVDKDKAWWETPSRRRGSMSSRPRKAEAFDGEYDETNAPTRFKPPLYLKCGPLLRFCGLRSERIPARSARNGDASERAEREIWRGSVMIVTQDSASSYDIAPTLRLFVQPIELLPPPPAEIHEELAPEYVDPIAGHPKLGRKGETLYVRPVEHLEEGKDLSRDETDDGIFEKTRSPPDEPPADGSPDPPGSFASRRKRAEIDGEKVGKYKDVRGFRLHSERGCTFWRFNIEVELREKQQRVAYRINRGPSTGFWVPAQGQAMNIMFYTCNGFSLSAVPDQFSGPDPMWRDVLNTHQSQPFHVMIGGGDQIYNDAVMRQTKIFQDWLMIKNPLHKHNAPFTAEMQDEIEVFLLERYCMWFSQGLFGMANSQIPMVNMYDDHDIIDGFGSYPHHFMTSPVFSGLGNVAFKYYMLFQHQSVVDETESSEPSWTLGLRPGPYITEVSRSLFMFLGSKVALVAVDCRTERTRDEVVRDDTWKKIMDRCYSEIVKGKTEHLLVLLGVPIAYPRLVWLENILTSRLMDPVKAISKTGVFGNVLNRFDGGVEILDDLDDHWTAKNHKHERSIVIEDLQDLAADKSVRVTILSGDVHLAAVGQFYSNPKLGLPKHKDFRYMPNIISSAIVNTPPPDIMADILNRRNKVHHFDKETDEDMIPLFDHGVEGKPRNNKRLLPHRNWCSIREYAPGHTPPPTPPLAAYDKSPLGSPPGRSIMRRLSKRREPSGPAFRPDAPRESRPPLSGGGFMRSFSRRASSGSERPGILTRTLSLSRGDFRPGNLFRRMSGKKAPDDGGINGQWGADSDDDLPATPTNRQAHGLDLRGGGGSYSEFEEGDEAYFTAQPPRRAHTLPTGQHQASGEVAPASEPEPRLFHRTPTGLSVKQMKRAERFEVNLEGGLDICLNVEVNQRDPAGITVPYRLLVPRLFYEYEGEDPEPEEEQPTGIKRWISLKRGPSTKA